jgi:tetratricopeptide (TPR) repeat protein
VADLTKALDLGAAETRIYFIRALARARTGDRAGAQHDRAEGLRRTPADAESWVARGLARLPSSPAAALADFEAALRLDPRCRSALQNKAAVLSERLGRTGEAIAVLDRAITLYPDFVPSRVGRGVLLARLGRRADAHRDAEESWRRDASSDTAYRAACIYALTARADPADRLRALGMLATALGQKPSWAEVARTDPDLDALRDQAVFPDLLRAFAPASDPAG